MTVDQPAPVATHGPRAEARILMRLATPAILTQIATMLMGLVDTLLVARLGTEALAGTSLGAVWIFGTLFVGMGIIMGMDPIVAQAHGAKDGARCGVTLQRGLVLAVLVAVPIVAAWAFTEDVLLAAGQDPQLARLAHDYVIVQWPSAFAILLYTALREYLSCRGIMVPALIVAWVGNVINALGAWVLIFGHLGFEPRGVVGAGIARSLAQVFLLVALLAVVLGARLHEGAWVPWGRHAFDLRGLRELLRHGIPAGLQIGLEVWGFQVATLMAGALGASQLAAHVIVLHVASMTFMVPLGIGIAATTRVGNLLGAREGKEARLAGWVALALGGGVMTVSAVSFTLLRWQIPRLWDPAPDVLAFCASIFPVCAAFQVFDGTQAVGCGILRGRGDTLPGAVFNAIGYFCLALPVAWLLAFRLHVGLPGVWWGLVVGLMTVATLLVWRIVRRH